MVNWWFAGCVGGCPLCFFCGNSCFWRGSSWLGHWAKSPPNSPTRRWNPGVVSKDGRRWLADRRLENERLCFQKRRWMVQMIFHFTLGDFFIVAINFQGCIWCQSCFRAVASPPKKMERTDWRSEIPFSMGNGSRMAGVSFLCIFHWNKIKKAKRIIINPKTNRPSQTTQQSPALPNIAGVQWRQAKQQHRSKRSGWRWGLIWGWLEIGDFGLWVKGSWFSGKGRLFRIWSWIFGETLHFHDISWLSGDLELPKPIGTSGQVVRLYHPTRYWTGCQKLPV